MSRKKDKKVFKTQQEIAFERLQQRELNESIEARERREKLLARGQLGQQSLLSGTQVPLRPSKQVRRRAQSQPDTGATGTAKALGPGRVTPSLIGSG